MITVRWRYVFSSAFSWAYVMGGSGWLVAGSRFGPKRSAGRIFISRCLPCCRASSDIFSGLTLSLPVAASGQGLADTYLFPSNECALFALFGFSNFGKRLGVAIFNSAHHFTSRLIFAQLLRAASANSHEKWAGACVISAIYIWAGLGKNIIAFYTFFWLKKCPRN